MKPDWDKLATEYEGSDKVLIADADCTGAGKPLCEKFGVRGIPMLVILDGAGELVTLQGRGEVDKYFGAGGGSAAPAAGGEKRGCVLC